MSDLKLAAVPLPRNTPATSDVGSLAQVTRTSNSEPKHNLTLPTYLNHNTRLSSIAQQGAVTFQIKNGS